MPHRRTQGEESPRLEAGAQPLAQAGPRPVEHAFARMKTWKRVGAQGWSPVRQPASIFVGFLTSRWGCCMTSVQNNDQRLLDRILDDQHRRLVPEKGRDDFFTFFAADKALQDWDLDNDEITDGIVDGAHDCGIDGIWTFVDDRYVAADAHHYLPSRANTIELVILQARTSPGYQETVIEKLHFQVRDLHGSRRGRPGSACRGRAHASWRAHWRGGQGEQRPYDHGVFHKSAGNGQGQGRR